MTGFKKLIALATVAIVALALAACSSDMTDAEIEEAARGMGMMTQAEADAMAGDATMTDAEIQEAARGMGMMTAEEGLAMASEMGLTISGGNRLQQVQERGHVICASNNSLTGFGYIDENGNTLGFDVDLCRAIAAAVLGDPDAVEFRPTVAAERGPTMQSGEVDLMSRNTTWTSSRNAQWGNFAPTMFYDGQGFMVPNSLGVSSMMELQGAKICVQQGTTTELNVQDFDNQHSMGFEYVIVPDNVSANEAYLAGQCDALTTDRSGLVSTRQGFDSPDDHTILAGTISEEPLGPVVPHGDEQWYDLVSAVMTMLIYSEAFGITSSNVPTSPTGETAIDRMFGLEGGYGQETMGLSQTAAQDVIRMVGNYGEIYDRHLTPLGLEREGSRNALWSAAPCTDCPKGGQVYAAPLR